MRRSPYCVCLAASAVSISAAAAFAQEPPLVTGLNAPRGLSVVDGSVLVAEQGKGQLLLVAPDGGTQVVLGGIPAGQFDAPEGPTVAGPDAAIKVGERYFYTVAGSLGTIAGSEAVYTFVAGETPRLLADLGRYEAANNTGGDVDQSGAPEINSNPFDLVTDGGAGIFVTDAAANAVFHVGAGGDIILYAQFADRKNPLFGTIGGPTFDQVPTGLATGPDGALYVTTLTGFPFVQGAARVYRMEDANDDGDALDEGETTIFVEGLTTATDLAFGSDGTLFVTEFSTDMLHRAPGRLVNVIDGRIAEVRTGLVSPTAVAILDSGKVLVTQEFPGLVTVAAISSSAGLDVASWADREVNAELAQRP
jgi:hypothetical protein